MRVWRLSQEAYARDLSGLGSKTWGGRWNPEGYAVVYSSGHLSLALLEVLANYPAVLRDDLPRYIAVEIDIPEQASIQTIPQLPKALRGDALKDWCLAQGKSWLDASKELVLKVPSALVPQEWNYVINADHSEMAKVTVRSSTAFGIDGRLLRKSG